MAEVWDIIDERGNKTGRTILRGETLQPGEYHLVVHVWLRDKQNNFLIQKRAGHVEWAPGKWAATGGSALAGEDSLTAIIRETKEELGITLTAENLQLLDSLVRRDSITDVWLAEISCTAESCVLEDAVAAIKYVTVDELMRMHETGKFVDYRGGEMYTQQLYNRIFRNK